MGANGVETALRFDELHHRLRLLDCVKNRGLMLHLLHALADTGTAGRRQGTGMAQAPLRVFSEPSAGLSGIDRVAQSRAAPTVPVGGTYGGEDANGGAREEQRIEAMARRRGRYRARETTDVTERTLLRGILYAFQVRSRDVRLSTWRRYKL